MAWHKKNQRLAVAALLSMAVVLPGCNLPQDVKNLGDYLNLRNGLLNPAEVGRFDNGNPWGNVRPIKLPILETLDVVEEPNDRWASATEPLPTDALVEPHDYTIGPGDVLRVNILGLVNPGVEWERDLPVGELGVISVPNVGTVQVQGLTPSEAEEKIAQLGIEKKYFTPKTETEPGPQISVVLMSSRNRVFSVIGNVQRPNTYQLVGNDFRLLDALALAGDITGGTQPGMDYVYVIRHAPSKNTPPALPERGAGGTGGTTSGGTPTNSGSNPLEALENIEKGTSQPSSPPPSPPQSPLETPSTSPFPPAPSTTPTPSAVPSSRLPVNEGTAKYVRPVTTADIQAAVGPGVLAQADLDAALGGGTTSGPATAPSAAPSTPAAPASGTVAETTPPAATAPATGPSGHDLLDQAVTGTAPGRSGDYVYIDGKWVPMGAQGTATGPATAGSPAVPTVPPVTTILPPGTMGGPGAPVAANPTPQYPTDQIAAQRVIRIPVNQLREGVQRYNIVILPGDVINVPTIEQGEFYVMGHVNAPGVYALSGRKVTLKMAIAAAHGFDPVAIPRRCELWRRIGTNQEAVVQMNMQEMFDANQPDIYLKPNDLVNIGTDAIAPFLAITRNAYRFSYGFGFVYDRNFYIQPTKSIQ